MQKTDVIKKYSTIFVYGIILICAESSKLSERKCEEYAEYVMSEEASPVLRMGAGKNKVSECGIIESPLIIGGVKAKSKEFPHMVAIGFGKAGNLPLNKATVKWECGGTIISEIFVLTAAHCMESRSSGPAIRVRAGTISMKSPESSVQERNVESRHKHSGYTPPSRYHDIGLLKLDEPWNFDGYVRPACLETNLEPIGKKAITIGFGKTSFDGEDTSDALLKVTLDYISNADCEKSFKQDIGTKSMPNGIIPNTLCAGVMTGGKDTCQGDSGGPLQRVLAEPYCMYSIVGVTSYGKFCGFANSPAIYTRVSSYLDWIEGLVWPGEK